MSTPDERAPMGGDGVVEPTSEDASRNFQSAAAKQRDAFQDLLGQGKAGSVPHSGEPGDLPEADPEVDEWLEEAAVKGVGQAREVQLKQGTVDQLEAFKQQRDEYYDRLVRLQAEFDNYRKRVERQQRDIVDNAATSLVQKLLPVLDAADLALAHGGGEDVKQVAGALFDLLAKEGLQRVVPEGQPFDPEHHDAVAHEPADGDGAPEVPEVSDVLRAGYEWKGRVLRPAMVKVRG